MTSRPRKTVHALLREARARLERLEPLEAAAAIEAGSVLIDIRPATERRRDGVIPGSIHVERNVLEWRVDPESGAQEQAIAGREDRLILICAGGYSSSLAAATLHELGFEQTTDVIGGFEAWRAAGLPVVREP